MAGCFRLPMDWEKQLVGMQKKVPRQVRVIREFKKNLEIDGMAGVLEIAHLGCSLCAADDLLF